MQLQLGSLYEDIEELSQRFDLMQVQREMSALYARFYGALLCGVLMATWLHRCACFAVPSCTAACDQNSRSFERCARTVACALVGGCEQCLTVATHVRRYTTLLVFALYSFWIPQIVLCVVADARQGLKPAYVTGMSVLRLALPLYVWACPRNLLKVPPSYGAAAGLIAFVGLQARFPRRNKPPR